ncbi:MAG: hypothetical protein DRN12_02105 [Thermoplasmata archaeon]|nr:MAG: hypothetical protein DRN12_02105 [Thermoplasmata archaeon]HEC89002.1 DUF4430 domain-containing protein [Thermoplasmatales archaeon]
MKKWVNSMIYIAIVLLLATAIIVVSHTQINSPIKSTHNDLKDDQKIHHVNLEIIAPTWNISYMDVTTSNITVAGLLLECAKIYNISIEKSYWTGYNSFFIESINGTRNGEDGRYWQYYVNGKYADVGCSSYTLHDYDTVEWRFERSPWG